MLFHIYRRPNIYGFQHHIKIEIENIDKWMENNDIIEWMNKKFGSSNYSAYKEGDNVQMIRLKSDADLTLFRKQWLK